MEDVMKWWREAVRFPVVCSIGGTKWTSLSMLTEFCIDTVFQCSGGDVVELNMVLYQFLSYSENQVLHCVDELWVYKSSYIDQSEATVSMLYVTIIGKIYAYD